MLSCAPTETSDENRTVFRYNESTGISSLDPAQAKNLSNIWACNQLFNGLVALNSNLKVVPSIATKWEVLDSGRLYRFYIRQDVLFHNDQVFESTDSRRVTAHDFEYSFKRILDPKTASPGSWIFMMLDSIDNVPAFYARNDTLFEIRLKQAFPPFLSLLSMQYCSVVPRAAVSFYGNDFRKQAIGTGPFYFKYWKEGVKLVLRKNPDYFEFDSLNNRLPYIDAVSISFLIDKQSAFLEFVKGQLDFISGIDASYKDEILTQRGELNPKYSNRILLNRQPYLNTEYLGFLISKDESNVVDDVSVRKAINYSLNREKMIRYLRNGIGIPGHYGIIPAGLPSFDSTKMKGYKYDPVKARELLLESRYYEFKDQYELKLSTTPEYLDLCKYLQSQLSDIGFDLKIDVHPPAALKELKANARLDFFRGSWIADYPDAENYLSLFYSKNFSPNGPNYFHYKNEEFDRLYEQSLKTVDETQRIALYQQMSNMIMDDSPLLVLYYDEVLRFTQKSVSGLGNNPINLLDLKSVHIRKPYPLSSN